MKEFTMIFVNKSILQCEKYIYMKNIVKMKVNCKIALILNKKIKKQKKMKFFIC